MQKRLTLAKAKLYQSEFERWNKGDLSLSETQMFKRSRAIQVLVAHKMARFDSLLAALKEVVEAADGKGWDQLDPTLKNQRAAIKAAETIILA